MRVFKTLLLPLLLILSLIGVDWRAPPPVGASLLAMMAAHSILRPADPPLSRASSLPRGIGVSQGAEH